MERRFRNLDVAVEKRDGQSPKLRGYAAVYYNGQPGTEYELWPGGPVERIMPGAFDRAIREDDVRALFNHDPNKILGRSKSGTLTVSSDARGLAYVIDAPNTETGRDVTAAVERGDVTGSSFSFIITEETNRKENGRRIYEIRGVRLFDVGPVTFPAYEGTSAEMRSADGLDERRKQTESLDKAEREREAMERDIMAVRMRQRKYLTV